jgi:hypothetical protein
MRGIKSPAGREGAPGSAEPSRSRFPLAKNLLHGGHRAPNGIVEPLCAKDGLALAAITP